MNKLQTVYIPSEKYDTFSVQYKLEEGSYAFVKQVEGYFFTPEELKQLLSDTFDRGEQSGMDSEFGRDTKNDKQDYIENLFK